MKFSEWLKVNDMTITKWHPVDEVGYEVPDDEVDIIVERYLRNVKKIYGDPVAADEPQGAGS